MKLCQKCQNQYPDDANFCPQETCATPDGPRRLLSVPALPARYTVRGVLGGEASGAVLLATDADSHGDVAIKVASPGAMPTPTTIERALRELKQLSRAASSHLVKVIDFGKSEDGRLYVVSEKVDGRTLEDVVNHDGPFAVDRAKKIVAQIGDALLDGQKVGVVHRDLSPKNVLLVAGDVVKVLNFVVARPVADHVFGTPGFLSPEQAEGKLVDQRSNTYGLAALLYFMVTGVAPFSGASARETLDAVLKTDLVPPSVRSPGVPPEVDRVVGKAMEKMSSRRPLTLRQFLNDVATLSSGQSGPTAVAPIAADQGKSPFAQTMVFGVSQKDVQQLVQQALAARGASAASAGSPAASPAAAVPVSPTSLATPAPQTTSPAASAPAPVDTGRGSRGHGAAVAATMVSMPAASGRIPGAPAAASPAKAAPAASPPAAAPSPASAPTPAAAGAPPAAGGAPNNFRETLWFKKGDVDQMVAEAKAKLPGAMKPTTDPEIPVAPPTTEEAKPLEDRYLDDGSLTADDRKKFSLRTGGTSTALPMVGEVPGDRMSDTELLDEISGKRKLLIGGVIAAVVVAIVAVLAVSLRSSGSKSPSSSVAAPPPAVAEPAPAPVPPPAEPAAAPAPEPAATAEAPAAEEPAPAKPAKASKDAKDAKHKSTAAAKRPAPPAKKHR